MSKIENITNEAREEIEAEMKKGYPGIGESGGKKLRGVFAVVVCDCFGGNHEKAVKFGSAVEFIHQGSIVHDDILDEHEERRGKPTKMISEGIKKALLIGDLMFTQAIKIGADGGSEEAKAVAHAMESVLKGAIKEASLPSMVDSLLSGDIEDDIYYKLIDLKTAALFGCASKFGAMSFTDDEKVLDDLFKYGMIVGEAYQIADDLVDMIDMAEGKKEINPLNVIPIIPAILKYNKNMIKKLPFKALTGRVGMFDMLTEGIGEMDISEKMLSDIKSKMSEADSILARYDELMANSCELKAYSKHTVNKMLEEAGEKI